jgi:hypothetical protein
MINDDQIYILEGAFGTSIEPLKRAPIELCLMELKKLSDGTLASERISLEGLVRMNGMLNECDLFGALATMINFEIVLLIGCTHELIE